MFTFLKRRRRKAWLSGMIAVIFLTACAAQPVPITGSVPLSNPPAVQLTATADSSTSLSGSTQTSATAANPDLPTDTPDVAATRALVPAANSLPQWNELASGLNKPTALVEIPDGSGRLAVLEQPGDIRLITKDGHVQGQIYLGLTGKVGSDGPEQGLLGLAFHPKFSGNGFFYIYYTDLNGNIVISRFHAASGAVSADAGSERMLLTIKKQFPNHNGGQLAFGPDGYLYIGVGDGGSEGDPQLRGQALDTLFGKVLRIDVDNGNPYAIPPTNPFAKGGGLREIFEVGLRNPWRFSFDKATGDLYIGDVGQDKYEEIDFVAAGSPGGLNFGWSYREGFHPFKGTPPAGLKLVDPVTEYGHSQGCAVIGGYVYRGQQFPSLAGTYFYGDDCSGFVWSLKRDSAGDWQNQQLYQTGLNISSFGQDLSGEMYLLDLTGGRVLRLAAN
jgi:glucose/arabinose dehydrogenase